METVSIATSNTAGIGKKENILIVKLRVHGKPMYNTEN